MSVGVPVIWRFPLHGGIRLVMLLDWILQRRLLNNMHKKRELSGLGKLTLRIFY